MFTKTFSGAQWLGTTGVFTGFVFPEGGLWQTFARVELITDDVLGSNASVTLYIGDPAGTYLVDFVTLGTATFATGNASGISITDPDPKYWAGKQLWYVTTANNTNGGATNRVARIDIYAARTKEED